MQSTTETELRVEGMHCQACVTSIERSIAKLPGVSRVSVNLITNRARVQHDKNQTDGNQLIKTVEKVGYHAELIQQPKIGETALSIIGMHCQACVISIEKTLNAMPGVLSASVNLATNRATVVFDSELKSISTLIQAIEKVGYNAEELEEKVYEDKEKAAREREMNRWKNSLIFASLFSIPTFVITMLAMPELDFIIPSLTKFLQQEQMINHLLWKDFILFLLTTPVQFIVGWQFYKSAYKSILNKTANMDLLIALGTSAAYFYSLFAMIYPIFEPSFESEVFFETAALLITFVVLGKYMEAIAKGRTSEAIKNLMNLQVKTAHVIRDN